MRHAHSSSLAFIPPRGPHSWVAEEDHTGSCQVNAGREYISSAILRPGDKPTRTEGIKHQGLL